MSCCWRMPTDLGTEGCPGGTGRHRWLPRRDSPDDVREDLEDYLAYLEEELKRVRHELEQPESNR